MVLDAIPRATKHAALDLVAQGYSQQEAADICQISLSTVQRAKHRLAYHGDIEGGKKKQGAKAKLDHELKEVMPFTNVHT